MGEQSDFFSKKSEGGLIALLLLLSGVMRLLALPKNVLDYDEGHWLMFGTLAARGHTPYTELFVGIPPLALLTVQLSAALFGSELTVRLPMMLLSLPGVWAIYRLVGWQAGPLAGLLAATVLSFQANYFFQSASLMTEVPAVSLALLALALIGRYSRTRARRWLFLGGVATAASLLMKLFVILLPVLVGLQLLAAHLSRNPATRRLRVNLRPLAAATGIWLLGVVAVTLPCVILFDPAAMFTSVLQFRFLLREAKFEQEGITAGRNLMLVLASFWQTLAPLLVLALLSLALLLARRADALKAIWLWPAWFFLAVLVMVNHTPFRERYVVMLVPPLAALVGMGAAQVIEWLSAGREPARRRQLAGAGLLATLLLMLVQPATALTAPPEESWLDAREVSRRAAAAFVHRITAPDDCIVVDDQRFAFLSGRLVPPWLSETSTARLQVGWLTSDVIADAAARADCAALVYISDRFPTYLPDLDDKAGRIFALKVILAESNESRATTLFIIPYQLQRTPAIPLDYTLGDIVTLKGVDVTPGPWHGGQEISLSAYWKALGPIPVDYKVFVHLRDTAGNTVASFDHYPFETRAEDHIWAISPTDVKLFETGDTAEAFKNYPATGLLPTRLWPPGNVVRETITVRLPNSLPAGNYSIALGLYDESGGERLPVWHNQAPAANNEIVVEIPTDKDAQ
ncbi:MAG: hypothetical protein Kow0031_21560 [Anaerolineae bacterium]